ncbi:MAG: hypothetical protein ACFCGT_28015 [Sandaracinaceae bacterium]
MSTETMDDLDEIQPLLRALPYPIALPAGRAFDRERPAWQQVAWGLFAAEQTLRTVALVSVASYLQQKSVDPTLSVALGRLHVPCFEDWKQLAQIMASGSDSFEPPMADSIIGALRALERKKGQVPAYRPADDSGQPTVLRGQISALQDVRNHYFAHDSPLEDEDEARALALYVQERLLAILRAFAFLSELSVHHRTVDGTWLLRGPVPVREIRAVEALEVGQTRVAFEDERWLVFPLFASIGEETELLRLLDGNIPAVGSWYISPSGAAKRRVVGAGAPTLSTLDALLERKRAGVRALLRHRAAEDVRATITARSLLQLDRHIGVKYFPRTHLPRAEVDGVLERFATDSTQPALLVTGHAGCGKTAALCRFVGRLIGGSFDDRGDDVSDAAEERWPALRRDGLVLFLHGEDFGRSSTTSDWLFQGLQEAFGLVDVADWPALLSALRRQRKKVPHGPAVREVWIVLEALNECRAPARLAEQVEALLDAATDARSAWLRVVVSIRADALRELRGSDALSAGEVARAPQDQLLGGARWAQPGQTGPLEVKPFHLEEAEAAYRRARAADPRDGLAWSDLRPHLRAHLRHPLSLRIFAEAARSPADLAKAEAPGGLFELFFEHLRASVGHPIEVLLEHLERGLGTRDPSALKDETLHNLHAPAEAGVPGGQTPLQAGLTSGLLMIGSNGFNLRLSHEYAAEALIAGWLRRHPEVALEVPLGGGDALFRRGRHLHLARLLLRGQLDPWRILLDGPVAAEAGRRPGAAVWRDVRQAFYTAAGSGMATGLEAFERGVEALVEDSGKGSFMVLAALADGVPAAYRYYGRNRGRLLPLLRRALDIARREGASTAGALSSGTIPMLLTSLASIEMEAGNPAAARALLEELSRRGQNGGDAPGIARVSSAFGSFTGAMLAAERGAVTLALERYAESQAVHREALRSKPDAQGVRSQLATVLVQQSELERRIGDHIAAERSLREAIELCHEECERFGSAVRAGRALVMAYANLGIVEGQAGRHDAAGRAFAESTARGREVVDSSDGAIPDLVQLSMGLRLHGTLLFKQGRPHDAVNTLEEACQVARRCFDRSDQSRTAMLTLVLSLSSLGSAQRELRRVAAATSSFEEALAWSRRLRDTAQGPSREVTTALTSALGGLGSHLVQQGRLAEARPYLKEALALQREWLDGSNAPDHEVVEELIGSLVVVATTDASLGWTADAALHFEEAVARARGLLEASAPTAKALYRLCGLLVEVGRAHLNQGRLDDAQMAVEEAVNRSESALQQWPGDASVLTARHEALFCLGLLRLDRGERDSGHRLVDMALAWRRQRHQKRADPGDALVLSASLVAVAVRLVRHGDLDRGVERLEEAVAVDRGRVEAAPQDGLALLQLSARLRLLASLHLRRKQHKLARGVIDEALALARRWALESGGARPARRSLVEALRAGLRLAPPTGLDDQLAPVFEEAIQLGRDLSSEEGASLPDRIGFAQSLLQRGRRRLRLGTAAAAKTDLEELLAVTRETLQLAPRASTPLTHLVDASWGLAEIAVSLSRFEEAYDHYVRGGEAADRLISSGSLGAAALGNSVRLLARTRQKVCRFCDTHLPARATAARSALLALLEGPHHAVLMQDAALRELRDRLRAVSARDGEAEQ